MPVLVDSGFRRGTDIIKALAMGAQAVCIGRPYLWGLGAFGQPGVERVLDTLREETRAAMQHVGVPSIKHLTRDIVRRARSLSCDGEIDDKSAAGPIARSSGMGQATALQTGRRASARPGMAA